MSKIPGIPEISWREPYGSWASCSRNKKIETLNLIAPEIGPGGVLITTPRIRPPGARNPYTSDPFRGACSEIAEILKIWRNFGIFENSGNSRKILVGGLWILGILLATPKNRDSQAVSSRNRARRRADSDPPNPTPPGPGTLILATRFGARVPKSRKF